MVAVLIILTFIPVMVALLWLNIAKAGKNNVSKELIDSIKRKEDEDNLDDIINFLAKGKTIKYNINAWRN